MHKAALTPNLISLFHWVLLHWYGMLGNKVLLYCSQDDSTHIFSYVLLYVFPVLDFCDPTRRQLRKSVQLCWGLPKKKGMTLICWWCSMEGNKLWGTIQSIIPFLEYDSCWRIHVDVFMKTWYLFVLCAALLNLRTDWHFLNIIITAIVGCKSCSFDLQDE